MLQYTVPLFTVCIVCLYDLNLYSCRLAGIDITSTQFDHSLLAVINTACDCIIA